jgi:NAD(P)-dependent dehydrogenase (short-subunit alcohol dehydrogenase family)
MIEVLPMTDMHLPRRPLVVGGGTGIGRATAVAWAVRGASVGILDINREAAEETAAIIHDAGGEAEIGIVDITDEPATAEAYGRLSAGGPIDAIYVSAGIEFSAPTPETTIEQWRRVIDINLTGSFIVAKLGLTAMSAGTGGSIVLTSSVHGTQTVQGTAAYAATKGGIEALTRSLALEGAGQGVRVNTVAPGAILTAMTDREVATTGDPEGTKERIAGNVPMKRMAEASEVAEVVVFLCSPAAAYVTGIVVPVDGGVLTGLNSAPTRPAADWPIPDFAKLA